MVSIVERKHYHVVETGLTLLHHASVPLLFWFTTFQTTTYPISRIPTLVLSYQSPFEKKKSPNLQTFKNYKYLDVCVTFSSAPMHLINLILVLILLCLLVAPLNIMHVIVLIPSLKNSSFPIMYFFWSLSFLFKLFS